MSAIRVLIVEDERPLSLALAASVRQAGAAAVVAPTAALARRELEQSEAPFAAMILDIGLPDENGLQFLSRCPEELRPPVLVITAHGDIDNTIQARKLGVREFFPKPLDFQAFRAALLRLVRNPSPRPREAPARCAAYIGAAPAMRPVFQQIAHACASTEPVLIWGETGTGKSATADLIHRNGARSTQPLVHAHPGGAFQLEQLRDALAAATGGVLALDGIDQLSPPCQAELVGHWETDAPAFPRILATSTAHPRAAVESGAFRSDLFYRLQVLEVMLPPLRERREDLPALFGFFLAQLEPGRVLHVEDSALERLRSYTWPGNLRELRNVASYALTVSGGSGRIERIHLPGHIAAGEPQQRDGIADALERATDAWLDRLGEWPAYRALAEEWEKLLIQRLLRRFDGKIARLAAAMQANRTTLRKKLQD